MEPKSLPVIGVLRPYYATWCYLGATIICLRALRFEAVRDWIESIRPREWHYIHSKPARKLVSALGRVLGRTHSKTPSQMDAINPTQLALALELDLKTQQVRDHVNF
jgi:hypothetical protein